VSRIGRTFPANRWMGESQPTWATAQVMASPPPPARTTQKEIVVSLPAGSSF
jgi:hypothetical protein